MSYLPYDGGDEYTDPDGAGLDGAGGGGGHSDWPENRKLKAIRNVKAKATQARTDLTEGWTIVDPDDSLGDGVGRFDHGRGRWNR